MGSRFGAHVMSMSLGLDFPGLVARWTDNGLALQPATSRALEGYRDSLRLFGRLADVIRAAGPYGRSAIVIAATGNESQRGAAVPYTIGVAPPAASEGFVAVGALRRAPDGALDVADFSNVGASVVAPGVDILSAKTGGGFTVMSGTSTATPHARVSRLCGQRVCWSPRNASMSACYSRVSPETARNWRESPSSMPVPDWCARRFPGERRRVPPWHAQRRTPIR